MSFKLKPQFSLLLRSRYLAGSELNLDEDCVPLVLRQSCSVDRKKSVSVGSPKRSASLLKRRTNDMSKKEVDEIGLRDSVKINLQGKAFTMPLNLIFGTDCSQPVVMESRSDNW